ncbi:hypothetical protein [Bdellovibrio sp. NC01]|uniref:hypothetical protein n=1 Tax=Bdellovibrio sp. NC01 TaxID=2220073 RepID=UPI00115C13E7|nr:hypothetical protein [Bdellovibrio sp. NC01]QDK39270.1 hypothetical protein DOE51_17575 [Bdellovibrio sp. NC01]
MRSLLNISLGVAFALSTSTSTSAWAATAKPPSKPTKVQRPSQYVVISFDGGLNLDQWKAMRGFVATMKKAKKPVNFTYFVSGVYFLSHNNRMVYAPPKHTQGYSLIGFAEDNPKVIADRVDQLNGAFKEGQEIASKGNGHFDAGQDGWNAEDWASELKQYDDLLFGAFYNNKAQPNPTNKFPKGYAFESKDVVGFRAPFMSTTPDLYPSLKAYGYKYDASGTSDDPVWPEKDANGIWKYSTPAVELAGTGKKILNMDYNYFYAQSKAQDDLANRENYRKQMKDSYLNYFNQAYYGNRVPVFIGHHFELYNGGAYWDALQDFTKDVCGKAEVKCISYKQYTEWLSSLKEETLKAYKAGQFDVLPKPKDLGYVPARALNIQLDIAKIGEDLKIITNGSDFQEETMKVLLKVNGKVLPAQHHVNLALIRRHFRAGSNVEISAVVLDRKGLELQRARLVVKSVGTPQEELVKLSEDVAKF